MVLDPTLAPPATSLDSGSFSPAEPAPLQQTSTDHPTLLPGQSLAAYSTTAMGGGGSWFDQAALYRSPAAASSALEQLVGQNRSLHWLQPYGLGSYGGFAVALQSANELHTWRGNGEMVLALRRQNVVLLLASHLHRPIDLAMMAGRVMQTVPTWLHTSGTQIVDVNGTPVRLAALNWYGAEQQDFVVGGLDYRPYQAILQTIKRDGYNALRIPFSDQLVEQNPVVTRHVGANPELSGLHALDILDRIVGYAGALGISVILDNHRSDAGWSAEENGLWYTPDYPDAAFQQDWATMAARYGVNDVVVAADLRNEPHGPATWGDGNQATDWHAAAERAGDAVLKANPHLLIMVEGVELYAGGGGWWGGNLMGVAKAPVSLTYPDGSSAHQQLVYSPHDYGPDNCGGGCPWFNPGTTYESLTQLWEQRWGFITDDPAQPYAAPVWLGEFGTCNYRATCVEDAAPGSQGQWFSSLVRYIGEKGIGWAYWSANGTQSTGGARVYGALDWYGYFNTGWTTPYDFLDRELHRIQSDQEPTDPQTPVLANGQPRPQPPPPTP
jgi:aryl-phospho-beta-D-glucosidase BglC (GH1 family)